MAFMMNLRWTVSVHFSNGTFSTDAPLMLHGCRIEAAPLNYTLQFISLHFSPHRHPMTDAFAAQQIYLVQCISHCLHFVPIHHLFANYFSWYKFVVPSTMNFCHETFVS